MNIPNLGLNIQEGSLTFIIISIIFTFFCYISNNMREVKKKEQVLSFIGNIVLYINRFIHHLSNFFIIFTPYVFKQNLVLYIIYEFYLILALFCWFIFKECPISIHEKQLLDPDYINGQTKIHPFMDLIIPNRIFWVYFNIIYIINLLVMSYALYEYYNLTNL